MASTSRKTLRIERAIAAIAFAVPLAYLVTERTRDVFCATWSKPWTAAILAYGAFYAVLLASYKRELPRWVRALRTLGVVVPASVMAALVCAEIALRLSDHPAFEPLDAGGRHLADPDVGHVYVAN